MRYHPGPDPPLQYSLWSHDELLGYTSLGMTGADPGEQSGIFEPEPPFQRIEPIVTALQHAMNEFEVDAPLPAPELLAALSREEQVKLIRASLGAGSSVRRVVESQRAVDAFALHLRDEHDREVPTQFITIHCLSDEGPRAVTAGAPPRSARYVIVAQLEERAAS